MATDIPRIYASVQASEWLRISENCASYARGRDDMTAVCIKEARKCIRSITDAVRFRDPARMKAFSARCDYMFDSARSHIAVARDYRLDEAKHAEWAKQADARDRD